MVEGAGSWERIGPRAWNPGTAMSFFPLGGAPGGFTLQGDSEEASLLFLIGFIFHLIGKWNISGGDKS